MHYSFFRCQNLTREDHLMIFILFNFHERYFCKISNLLEFFQDHAAVSLLCRRKFLPNEENSKEREKNKVIHLPRKTKKKAKSLTVWSPKRGFLYAFKNFFENRISFDSTSNNNRVFPRIQGVYRPNETILKLVMIHVSRSFRVSTANSNENI